MDTNVTSEQMHGPHNPEVRHERSDVSAIGITVFGLGLIASAVIIYLIVWGLLSHFAGREAQSGRPLPTTVVPAVGKQTLPEPRLQVSPREDLRTMRAAEDAILNHYGWVDRQAGAVRIPVEQAMQILVQRGLPVQQDGNGGSGNRGTGAGQ